MCWSAVRVGQSSLYKKLVIIEVICNFLDSKSIYFIYLWFIISQWKKNKLWITGRRDNYEPLHLINLLFCLCSLFSILCIKGIEDFKYLSVVAKLTKYLFWFLTCLLQVFFGNIDFTFTFLVHFWAKLLQSFSLLVFKVSNFKSLRALS